MLKYFKKNKFTPKRIDLNEEVKDFSKEEVKLINLLNYTKKSASTYSGELYDVGYHTFNLGDKVLKGQRNPAERLKNVPFDFKGKSVLDIGSNQGGMLNAIAKDIKYGVGVDYDSRMVNVSNKIKEHSNHKHLQFYVFDLENENLKYLKDFLPTDKVDICFLLSVCMWLKNWKELILFVKETSEELLFESNGSEEQQKEQIDFLKANYKEVLMINEISDDDPLQKKRKLLLCRN
jgi:SAM-dependent methyltransferase